MFGAMQNFRKTRELADAARNGFEENVNALLNEAPETDRSLALKAAVAKDYGNIVIRLLKGAPETLDLVPAIADAARLKHKSTMSILLAEKEWTDEDLFRLSTIM